MVNFTSVESQVSGYLQVFDQPPRSFNLTSYARPFPFNPKYDFATDLTIRSSALNSQEQQAITLAKQANPASQYSGQTNLLIGMAIIDLEIIGASIAIDELSPRKGHQDKEGKEKKEEDYSAEIEEIRKRKPSGIG